MGIFFCTIFCRTSACLFSLRLGLRLLDRLRLRLSLRLRLRRNVDLAAGQLLDRAGNLLGLPFPSGGALDALALTAEPEKGFKPKVNECKFSLSGMQNQVENKFKTEKPEDMARFALETVANAVIKATEQAKERYDVPVLCAGGVMASRVIRARMEKRFGSGVSFAEPTLSGDNAVGVAVLAARLYRKTGADGQ